MVKNRPFIRLQRSKGKAYYYFQRHKRGVRIRLPDDPDSEEFDRAYWAARKGQRQPESKSTIEAVALSYYQSSKWERLSERSKQDYRKHIDYLREKAGKEDAAWFTRPRVIEMVEANKHRPRFANYIRQVLSILMEHAIDLGWRRDNPAKGVRSLPTGGGWEPWPKGAIEAFRKAANPRALLVFEMALGTGQRISDVLRMRWSDIDGDGILIVQGKATRAGKAPEQMWVPFSTRLSEILAQTERKGLTIISGEDTRPLSYRAAAHAVERAREASGTKDYKLHGLRANRASELYEGGASDAEVQAITGHKSVDMARRYGRGARQRKLAESAVKRGDQNTNRT